MARALRNASMPAQRVAGVSSTSTSICTGLLVMALFLAAATATAQSIPSDAQSPCTVTSAMFSSWFQSGTPALNGVVNPANSVTFPNTPNCSFYQWSKQMFLWLTSPAPSIYGGGSRIFDSPTFFDVSPPDASGNRTFIPHVPGKLRVFRLRAAKVGAHGLPIIFDKRGRMLEVHPAKLSPQGKPLVLNKIGKQVEVERLTIQQGKALFIGKDNKPIQAARPMLLQKPLPPTTRKVVPQQVRNLVPVQKFIIGGRPIFVDFSGNVIDTEEGQADGGVQLTQNNTLVYYASMVNDVYAYFLTGTKNGAIPPPGGNVANAQFPTTQTQLNAITALATAHGHTTPDGIALAVELKTSWVEASSVPDKTKYITMMATVPTYNTSNPNQWTQNGQKNVELALVGMHVVGSTAGHPEMIWATFEHFGNAPNATYSYVSTSGTKTVTQNTSGSWLFTANGSTGPFNCMRQQEPFGTTNIVPLSAGAGGCAPGSIGPSNTIRWKAFGGAFNQTPNPLDASTAASNSEIISVNNATQVPGSDVRNQYFMTGATWTIGGAAPSGMFPGGNEVGTSRLTNTTLETFDQGSSNMATPADTNCFSCHFSNKVTVSHVFCDPAHGCSAGLQPLFH
jgi:hypothetical protein